MTNGAHDPVRSKRFPRSHRLSGKLLFARVYDARVKQSRGPLIVFARPNELIHLRMGLSVSRRVGNAPRRNLIKRRMREAFRLMQHCLPAGYDLIIVVKPHQPATLADYQQHLASAVLKLHQQWKQIKTRGLA